ncbi:hypothetical protein Cgig2_018914 [Carnegiea gigantea]|uniref:Transposase n=1 Tax=Carnegiea gigantea TaxID=171969 RepID=A0A9Q1K5X1_9CARY|nr:hypothetical protein Cgig2_018914 [Carnegiea gigantea]
MLLSEVHAHKLEDHVPIFFNEHGQPIRPTEKACDEFIPDKDKMWQYVNHKYIVPQTASVKQWVLESIACGWRLFKCRLKANHYYKYDNDTETWKHRLSRIPDSYFKLLLQYWNTSTAKKISAQNYENRRLLDNMHTARPISFARIYQKLVLYCLSAWTELKIEIGKSRWLTTFQQDDV